MRCIGSFRGLQRKFIYVLLASALLFLVYLVISTSHVTQEAKRQAASISEERQRQQELPVERPPDGPKAPDVVSPDKKTILPPVGEAAAEEKKPLAPAVTEKRFPVTNKSTSKSADPYSGPKNAQQKAIVEAFLHAWKAYEKYAWGHDEFRPVTKGFQEWFGIGLTIVDSLDTAYIMGLKDEFKKGRDWVESSLSFNKDTDVQFFEIVIRALGGLLSAYHLSGDQLFLNKASELGVALYPCFGGPTKIPCNRINLRQGNANFVEISTAESGTVQLEFRDLAKSTGDKKFENLVEQVSQHLHNMPKMDGLVGCFINSQAGTFRMTSTVSFGASADSYYEYLIKQWIQTGKIHDWMKDDYLNSIAGMKKHLYRYSEPNKLAFVGALTSMHSKSFRSEMEHLSCFLPGTLALGYMAGIGGEDHLRMAKELTKTCYEMYKSMPTGLSPEVAGINLNPSRKEDMYARPGTEYNLQRPEAIESIFYLYRATKDPIYREWGWEIFQAFEKYTKLAEGYASISSVRAPEHPGYRDKMETFYLAETLKYLYLLFSDDPALLPLDKFVFNTEAHPLPVHTS